MQSRSPVEDVTILRGSCMSLASPFRLNQRIPLAEAARTIGQLMALGDRRRNGPVNRDGDETQTGWTAIQAHLFPATY